MWHLGLLYASRALILSISDDGGADTRRRVHAVEQVCDGGAHERNSDKRARYSSDELQCQAVDVQPKRENSDDRCKPQHLKGGCEALDLGVHSSSSSRLEKQGRATQKCAQCKALCEQHALDKG